MKRQTKKFIAVTNTLDREIETGVDLFFERRPWLLGKDMEPQILDKTEDWMDRKVENDIAVEEAVRVLKDYATSK